MARKRKLPAKHAVECPHCGGSQKESVYAQSTICGHCGRHFSIERRHQSPEGPHPKIVLRQEDRETHGGPGFLGVLSGFSRKFRLNKGPRRIVCHECGARSEASRAAQSTACPKCGTYIDLQDVIVDRPVSRAIRTQGDLTVTQKGMLSSTRAYVGDATIEGVVDGHLVARGRITVKRSGPCRGSLHAGEIEIAKKAQVTLLRSAHADTISVRGTVEGELHATGSVVVHKRGCLTGKVFARGFRVDKGGEFHGSLQIGEVVPPEREPGTRKQTSAREKTASGDQLPLNLPPSPSHS